VSPADFARAVREIAGKRHWEANVTERRTSSQLGSGPSYQYDAWVLTDGPGDGTEIQGTSPEVVIALLGEKLATRGDVDASFRKRVDATVASWTEAILKAGYVPPAGTGDER